jgi:hypothetical protein
MWILPSKYFKCPFQGGQPSVGDVKPSTILAVVAKLTRHISGKCPHIFHLNGIHLLDPIQDVNRFRLKSQNGSADIG